jgi:hypothetical protein
MSSSIKTALGFQTRRGAPSVSPPAVLPLVRLAAFQSVVCARLVGFIGSPLPLCPRRFRRSLRFYRSPSPARLRKRVHPLVSFTPLQSTSTPCPPDASRRQAPSMGLALPLRDINLRRPLRNGASTPRHLAVLGVSHAFDGFLRHRPCGFVSPHCRVQGFPSGVNPLTQPSPARR